MSRKRRRTADDFRAELDGRLSIEKDRKQRMQTHDRKSPDKRERAWGDDYWARKQQIADRTKT